MSKSKELLADIPVTFRVEQEIHDFIEGEMISRKIFNKSKIQREIFLMGLEVYKQEKTKKE